jgi:PhnB protein
MAVKPIPDGYHSVTPYLVVQGATQLIDFLKQAFDAEETERVAAPDGGVMHAEVRIGGSVIMMADATNEFKPMTSMIHLYVNDADTAYQHALRAGATSIKEPKNEFYGDRSATVKDALGNIWSVATHIEDVPPEELKRRVEAVMKQMPAG